MSTTPPRLPQLQGLTPLRFSPYRRSGSSPRSKRLSNYRRDSRTNFLPQHNYLATSPKKKTLTASTSMESLASLSSVSTNAIFADLHKSEANYLEELQLLIQSDLSPRLTAVVRKLKLLHDNMPTDGFFNWARDIAPLYASYIEAYSIDANTSTHMLYLLKRPLVRIRYLAKVLKKLAESSPEFKNRQEVANKFRTLTRQAREKAESERERVDLTTFSFDRVVNFDTHQETHDEFDYTKTLHRDYFEMCVKHRSGKNYDKKMVEVFLVTDSTTPNKGLPSNKISADAFIDTFQSLAICSLEDPGRSLLFPLFKKGDFVLIEQPKSRLSSRQAKYEIVLQAPQNNTTMVLYCPELDQVKLWTRVLTHLFGHVTDYSASKANADLLKLTFGQEYSFGIESSRILAGKGGLGIEIEKPKSKSKSKSKEVPRLESSLSLGPSLFGESLDKFKYERPVEALKVVKKESKEVKDTKEVPPLPKELPPAPKELPPPPPAKPSFAAAALAELKVTTATKKPEPDSESERAITSQSTSMESITSEIMDRGSSDTSWSELEEEAEPIEIAEIEPKKSNSSKRSNSPASTVREAAPQPRDNSAAIVTRRCAATTSLVEPKAPALAQDSTKSSSVIGGNQYESFTANTTPGDTQQPPLRTWNSSAMLRPNPKFVPPEGVQSKFSPEMEQPVSKFGKWFKSKDKAKEKKDKAKEKEAKLKEKEARRLEKEAKKPRSSAFSALKTVSQLVKPKPQSVEPTFLMVEPKAVESTSCTPSSFSSSSIDTPRLSALLPSPMVRQNSSQSEKQVEDGFELISPSTTRTGPMTAPLPQLPTMPTTSVPPVPAVTSPVPSVALPEPPKMSPPPLPYMMDNDSTVTITANQGNEAAASTTSFVTAPSSSPTKLAPPPPPSRRPVQTLSPVSSIKSDLQAMSRSLNESLSKSASVTMSSSTSNSTIASLAMEEKELLKSSTHLKAPSLSMHLRSVKSLESLPSTISSKSISEDSEFSFLENDESVDNSETDSDVESVHVLDTPEIEQLEMTSAKAVMVVRKLPSEPSDSSISSKRSMTSSTSSGSKNSIKFTPLRAAKSEELLLKSKPVSEESDGSEESDTLAPLVKVKQRVSRVGSPAECLTAPATINDGTVIYQVRAFTSRWKGNTWESLSESMISLRVCVGSEGGRLEIEEADFSISLNKQSALRRGTAVDVQLRQSTDIYSFRLRNSREADALLSTCNSAKMDLVDRPILTSRKSTHTASICSDSSSSLGTVGSGSMPLSLKPRNKLSLLAQEDGLLLLQNLTARLFLSPRMSKLWLSLGLGVVSVNVSTEDLMTNTKTVTMKQQGFEEAVFSGSLPAHAFARDGTGIRVYADYEHLSADSSSPQDLPSNVYYLQLKNEKEVDKVFEILTTS